VYGLAKFVYDDIITIHFLHLYAILFVIEVGIMLASGYFRPLADAWSYERRDLVDLTPWRYAIPVAFTLFSAIVFLYLLFSPIGLVGGVSRLFVPLISALGVANVAFWWRCILRRSTAS
jgi:SSS family solute:Na+ symporter